MNLFDTMMDSLDSMIDLIDFEIQLDKAAHISKPVFNMPKIENVVFNNPATIVFWSDGSKTIVKCQAKNGDTYSKETGLAMAIAKKAYGNKGNFNDIFKTWVDNK